MTQPRERQTSTRPSGYRSDGIHWRSNVFLKLKLDNSVLKKMLIGPRGLHYSQNTRKIGNHVFICSTILEILEIEVSVIPRILETRAADRWLLLLGFAGLIYFWNIVPGKVSLPLKTAIIFQFSNDHILKFKFKIQISTIKSFSKIFPNNFVLDMM